MQKTALEYDTAYWLKETNCYLVDAYGVGNE